MSLGRRFGSIFSDTGAHFVALGRWAVTIARVSCCVWWGVTVSSVPGGPRYGSIREVVVGGVIKVGFVEDALLLCDGREATSVVEFE